MQLIFAALVWKQENLKRCEHQLLFKKRPMPLNGIVHSTKPIDAVFGISFPTFALLKVWTIFPLCWSIDKYSNIGCVENCNVKKWPCQSIVRKYDKSFRNLKAMQTSFGCLKLQTISQPISFLHKNVLCRELPKHNDLPVKNETFCVQSQKDTQKRS